MAGTFSDLDYSGLDFGSASVEEKEPIWMLVVKIICCSVGLAGNLIVIFVLWALKEYKDTVTNWYVLQLAIADLMFLCTIPIKIQQNFDGKWPGSETLCKLNESLIFLNYNSSILFLTVMSIDRYLVVCHNTSTLSQTLRKRSTAYIATVVVWVVSLVCCTPVFMYSRLANYRCIYEFAKHNTPEDECRAMGMEDDMENCVRMFKDLATNPDGNVSKNLEYENIITVKSPVSEGLPFECSYENESDAWFAFIYFNFIVLFIIPFIVMLICYSLIVKRMIRSKSRRSTLKSVATVNAKERSKSEKRKITKSEKVYRRATRLCVTYVVLFAICWLPFHSIHLAKATGIHQTSEFCVKVSSISFIFVIANSTINPCLYSIVDKTFIARLRKAFSSMQGKITNQVNSLSSSVGLTARYRRGTGRQSTYENNTTTETAKVYKGKRAAESHDRSSSEGRRASGSV